MRLWELPGAVRFVDTIQQSLRAGVNVVVRFPGTVPPGFRDIVSLDLTQLLAVGRIDCGRSPFEQLCAKFSPGKFFQEDDLRELCEDDGFRGRLIWLDGLDQRTWPKWRTFLTRYAQASRSVSAFGRTLFIATLDGEPPGESLDADVTIVTHDWSNAIDEIDLLLLANERLLPISTDSIQRQLLATTVARVASWDFETARQMLDGGMDVILEPLEMLRSIAKSKGWTTATPVAWELGTASGSGVAHPALAALEVPAREIRRRLWSAQASVLFPLIEIRRDEIVRRNLYVIQRNLHNRGEDTTDPQDMEIGDLYSMFQRANGSWRIRKSIRILRNARNALAHLEPLPARQALELARFNRGYSSGIGGLQLM